MATVKPSGCGPDIGGDIPGPDMDMLVPAGMLAQGQGGRRRGGPSAAVQARYTKVGEHLRRVTPGQVQCSVFCGGRRCKYEGPANWSAQDMAVRGVYSHWITGDILAMARPNAEVMERFQVVGQFEEAGIKSIINLQTPGEHANCGQGLVAAPDSPVPSTTAANRSRSGGGFAYDPNSFMARGIYYYNFAWRDFGEASSMDRLLDVVKVLSFALGEGKVAVHCHAGLGRTGVLISAYLVYSLRVRADDAIRYVRLKRPGSVQTRKQIECVKEFESFFLPQCLVFSLRPPRVSDGGAAAGPPPAAAGASRATKVSSSPDNRPSREGHQFTIEQYLKRQRYVLHGFEARSLRYLPKVVYCICERLVRMSGRGPSSSPTGPPHCCKEGFGHNFTRNYLAHQFDLRGGGPRLASNFKASMSSSTCCTDPSLCNASICSSPSSDSVVAAGSTSRSATRQSLISTRSSVNSNSFEYETSKGGGDPSSPCCSLSASSCQCSGCSCCGSSGGGTLMETLGGDPAGLDSRQEGLLEDNLVSKEMDAHQDMLRTAAAEALPRCTPGAVLEALLTRHWVELQGLAEGVDPAAVKGRPEDPQMDPQALLRSSTLFKNYKVDLNFRMSAWDRLEAETDLFVLTGLLLEWLEHLKVPVLAKESITYVVIHCDQVEAAVGKLPLAAAYLIEYLVRFVARLDLQDHKDVCDLLRRFIGSLTHQCLLVRGVVHPAGKGFPRLRSGTEESTLRFLMNLHDKVNPSNRVLDHFEQGELQPQRGTVAQTGASSFEPTPPINRPPNFGDVVTQLQQQVILKSGIDLQQAPGDVGVDDPLAKNRPD